ncbi:NAD-dependent protein deacylase Sirt4-like [Cimex lectularius]|uniref:Deacetylase sirtuin-type domain-containing protein n=1 Tax=Cimex lectularius TaxID=79782 RepID=A0A8I6RGE1_CIMLE|nr:NAD-dependent protein deacylase Sirt4-like [Cimex lectularius]
MRVSVVSLCEFLCSRFVPRHEPVKCCDIRELTDFIADKRRLLVLTGAGISTESGLPDYRSEDVGLYKRNGKSPPYVPISYQQFINNHRLRTRFWLRNYLGWEKMFALQPNSTHLTLKKMETLNKVFFIVTQNVDSLHEKAKSLNVVELHGSAYRVKCLSCSYSIKREFFQEALVTSNPYVDSASATIAPDGYVELQENDDIHFAVPDCPDCGDLLKPDIVFFGENIPKERLSEVSKLIHKCDSLLVLGSTLTVNSSYRIVHACHEMKKPIAIVNIGPTRGDNFALIKIDTRCGAILPLVFQELWHLESGLF